jgi:hypothetical protein
MRVSRDRNQLIVPLMPDKPSRLRMLSPIRPYRSEIVATDGLAQLLIEAEADEHGSVPVYL